MRCSSRTSEFSLSNLVKEDRIALIKKITFKWIKRITYKNKGRLDSTYQKIALDQNKNDSIKSIKKISSNK